MFENNSVISKLLGFNYFGHPITLYGNAGSGKTTSCLLLAQHFLSKNLKVIYIDSEQDFHLERFVQIGGTEKMLDNMFLLKPKSFEEQTLQVEKIYKLCENDQIKLVIMDSLGCHYKKIRNENPAKYNKFLLEQTKYFIRISRDLNKTVMLTNQVYSGLEQDNVSVVGGQIGKMGKVMIEFQNNEEKFRKAILVKNKTDDQKQSANVEKEVHFKIVSSGFELVEDKPIQP